jgi:1-aminocyclopropane-1-carboxylate deaminase/D-cysteine desulfhydrase-like pyridoxal-dependent ACC family enzyme
MSSSEEDNSKSVAMYKYYPKLKDIPRTPLINIPTPIEKMENAGKHLNGCNIWIKRDDLDSSLYGGNKPRKFEFVIGDALKKKKTNLITIGGIGSNHVLANSIFAHKMGLQSEIFLFDQPLTEHVRANLLSDLHYNAQIHYVPSYVKIGLKIIKRLIFDKKSYLIMPGASIPIGTVGFVNAGLELAEQIKDGIMPEPDKLFVAVGSTGTCAGLALGFELAGLKTKIHGIAVTIKMFCGKKSVLKLAKKTLKLLRKYDPNIPDVSKKLDDRFIVDHSYFGGEYGRATFEGLDAMKIAAMDDIHLDITYTGKTFSALVDYCQNNPQAKDESILYWNTLNSVDLKPKYSKENYKNLPSNLHQFFDESIPLDEEPVHIQKNK